MFSINIRLFLASGERIAHFSCSCVRMNYDLRYSKVLNIFPRYIKSLLIENIYFQKYLKERLLTTFVINKVLFSNPPRRSVRT